MRELEACEYEVAAVSVVVVGIILIRYSSPFLTLCSSNRSNLCDHWRIGFRSEGVHTNPVLGYSSCHLSCHRCLCARNVPDKYQHSSICEHTGSFTPKIPQRPICIRDGTLGEFESCQRCRSQCLPVTLSLLGNEHHLQGSFFHNYRARRRTISTHRVSPYC